MDDKPDQEDIPVPRKKRQEQPRPEDVRTRNDDSGPDASEAPEEEGSASRP